MLGDTISKISLGQIELISHDHFLSQSEGQMLIEVMNDHGLDQLVHFSTRKKNTVDLILTSLPGQFQEIHSQTNLVIMI